MCTRIQTLRMCVHKNGPNTTHNVYVRTRIDNVYVQKHMHNPYVSIYQNGPSIVV